MTANLGPVVAVKHAAAMETLSNGDGVAASLRRSFGPEAALRVLLRDATGRLRTTLTEGSWPEEADAMSAARRRPAFDGGADVEIRLPSPAGTALLLLPMTLKGEAIGIVEILAPSGTVAKHRAYLPAFVESIATTFTVGPRLQEPANGSSVNGERNGNGTRPKTRLKTVDPVANGSGLDGVRVLIVDKHKLFAEVIRSVLEERGAEVLQPVDDPGEALALASKANPHVVLIDLALNGSAMTLGGEIGRECPGARVIGLTALADPVGRAELVRSGFHGYLTKDVSLERFVSSLRAALAGDPVAPLEPSRWTPPSRTAEERHAEMITSHLTPREREVLERLVEGLRSEEIARRLSASPNTVRTHIQSILAKLQVHSRLQAVTFAVKNGLVRIPGDAGRSSDEGTPESSDIGVMRRRSNGRRYTKS